MAADNVRNGDWPFKENYGVTDPSPLEPLIPGRGPSSSAPPDATRIFRNDPVPDKSVIYRLGPHELFQAAQVGISRRIDHLWRRNGAKEPHGTPEEPWWADITGACGELCVARYLDVFWSGQLGEYETRDAGPTQVRTTKTTSGHLLLYPDDAPDQAFVLVTERAPRIKLVGWLFGRDGKLDKWWSTGPRERPPGEERWSFWVPQSELEPMYTLKEAIGYA